VKAILVQGTPIFGREVDVSAGQKSQIIVVIGGDGATVSASVTPEAPPIPVTPTKSAV
jgi:hypothetical protein